jgi:hypothetical protein
LKGGSLIYRFIVTAENGLWAWRVFLYILMLWIMQLYSTVKKIISNDYESSQQ